VETVTFKEDIPAMDYKMIQDTLEKLCEATANLLEREWPKHYRVDSARVVFFQSLRIAINTYATIFYIIADIEEYGRKKVYALSLPPLVRTLFEQLITFLFLMQDIPTYIPWLFKTGYTERRIQLEHVEQYHGGKANWDQYIDALKKQIAIEEKELGLTVDEISRPIKHIGRWPTPGKMLLKLRADGTASQDVLDYVEYLNSWLYRELSGQTHLNVSGVTQRGIHFSVDEAKLVFGEESWKEQREQMLEYYRQNQVWLTVILMLSIVSEIEGHFHFGRNQKAREVWTILSQYSDIALEFWEMRYRDLLPE
jgi:hypothetical protein